VSSTSNEAAVSITVNAAAAVGGGAATGGAASSGGGGAVDGYALVALALALGLRLAATGRPAWRRVLLRPRAIARLRARR
jgi:hypothetical protein